jgi:hypothetical protein
MDSIQLGDVVRDRATSFSGHATARLEELGGAPQLLVERLDKDGERQREWFEEGRLEKTP